QEQRRRLIPVLLGTALLAVAAALVLPALGVAGLPNLLDLVIEKPAKETENDTPPPVHLVKGQPDTFTVDPDTLKQLKVPVPHKVQPHARPRTMELSGSLAFNPSKLGQVQSRFPGEVIEIGPNQHRTLSPSGQTEKDRPIKFGDRVSKGQLMAVVW